jgi:hypothetical protein
MIPAAGPSVPLRSPRHAVQALGRHALTRRHQRLSPERAQAGRVLPPWALAAHLLQVPPRLPGRRARSPTREIPACHTPPRPKRRGPRDSAPDTLVLILDGGCRLAIAPCSTPGCMNDTRGGRFLLPAYQVQHSRTARNRPRASQEWPQQPRRAGNTVPGLPPVGDGPGASEDRITIVSTCLSRLRGPVQSSAQQSAEHGALASDR